MKIQKKSKKNKKNNRGGDECLILPFNGIFDSRLIDENVENV